MDLLNSLFGGRRAPSTTNSAQSTAETRLLEVDPPEPRRPLSETLASSNTTSPPQSSIELREQPAPQQNKAPVVFAAGLAFTAFSLLITRRSSARRRVTIQPSFYTNAPSHTQEQAVKVSGPMEAIEALSLATINVLSLTMAATGGALWYFDIRGMDDARRKLRRGLGVDGSGRSEGEAEEEFEEWLATVLDRKEAKERRREFEEEKEQRRKNERGRER